MNLATGGFKDGIPSADAHYRCDVPYHILMEILTKHPKLPSNFREIL